MRRAALVTSLIGCAILAVPLRLSGQSRVQQITAAFNKHKYAVKEHRGVTIEKYKDVRSEPVVKQNIGDYAGAYEVSGLGYAITLQVRADGTVQARGYDGDRLARPFDLKNARIQGSLITATKVYHDGTTEGFEGVFMNRTERMSPTDPGVTTFGLGVVLRTPVELDGMTLDKLFYQLVR